MSLSHDVRHAVRSLRRQPGFTAVTVATLALGLGINAAVFAVAYGILWRPLPFPEPDRLVTIATRVTRRVMRRRLSTPPPRLTYEEAPEVTVQQLHLMRPV